MTTAQDIIDTLNRALEIKMPYTEPKKRFLLCGYAVYKMLMEERREKNCIKNFVRYGFDKKLIRSILNKKPLGKKQPYQVIESQKYYYEDENW